MKEMHARANPVLTPSLKREVPRTYKHAGRMSWPIIFLLGFACLMIVAMSYHIVNTPTKPRPAPAPTVYVEETVYSDGTLGYGFNIKNPTPDKFYLKIFIDRFSGAVTWYYDGMEIR